MRATFVPFGPPPGFTGGLSPELAAATFARYSRSNVGLEAILASIDRTNPDASVDRIFKFIDYGHASVGDMAYVAIALDGVPSFVAFHLWLWSPFARGQETSTRYVPPPSGIYPLYDRAREYWEDRLAQDPSLLAIPKGVYGLKAERMRRNFALDRARNFLPVTYPTNLVMIQPARGWARTIQACLSHSCDTFRHTGALLREELRKAAPRLCKYTEPSAWSRQRYGWEGTSPTLAPVVFSSLTVGKEGAYVPEFPRESRHDGFDSVLERTPLSWITTPTFACARDLVRHGKGERTVFWQYYPAFWVPKGTPVEDGWADNVGARILHDVEAKHPSWWHNLYFGHRIEMHRTYTAADFAYEVELRTGPGAHFEYRDLYLDLLAKAEEKLPGLTASLFVGDGEAEAV